MSILNRFILILGITLAGTTALFGCTPQQSPPKESLIPPTPTPPIFGNGGNSTCNQSPAIAYPFKTQKVREIARAVTACITSQTTGSGVIIKRQGNVYTILTAAHVVPTENKYKVVVPDGKQYAIQYNTIIPQSNVYVVAPDGKQYPIQYRTIKRFPGKIDLAILQFTSDRDYRVVEIGDSTKVVAGTPSYVAGFPLQSAESTIQNYHFSPGQISANAAHPLEEGYALAYYSDIFSDMSGSAVLDKQGRLIGIHGKSKVDIDLIANKGIAPKAGIKYGLNLAIPIHTFMSLIAQVEPKLEFQPVAAVIVPPQQTADDAFLLGVDKAIAGNLQEAIAYYDQAIHLNSNYAQAYLGRGDARADKKGAIADYDQAIRLNPNFVIAYVNRGVSRANLGDFKGAIADYDQADNLNPKDDTYPFKTFGFTCSVSGNQRDAIGEFSVLMRINPSGAIISYNRGLAKYQLGEFFSAIRDFDHALHGRNDATTHTVRGLACYKLGDYKGAIFDFDYAIRINPNYADAYNNRGLVRSALGDKKGAIADIQKAADLFKVQRKQWGYQQAIALLDQISR
jgi:tetratricopeptide (TPR) repeat protein